MVRSGCFVSQVVAQPLKWLLLLATTMGMCLMNGYSVVKDPQTRLPYVRKEGREFSASLPSSSLAIAFTGHYLKKYFIKLRFFSIPCKGVDRGGFVTIIKSTALSGLC